MLDLPDFDVDGGAGDGDGRVLRGADLPQVGEGGASCCHGVGDDMAGSYERLG